jgi:hypothetical protein
LKNKGLLSFMKKVNCAPFSIAVKGFGGIILLLQFTPVINWLKYCLAII